MGCECYQIGGPWIEEDPSCPAHGQGGLQEQLDEAREEIFRLKAEIQALKGWANGKCAFCGCAEEWHDGHPAGQGYCPRIPGNDGPYCENCCEKEF